ncbi:MAG: glycosyltransferase family 4 protein, partial [Acidimicrobiia bacterium]
MRIAVIAESAPPDVNGVANSVKRMTRHFLRRGHEVMVIATGPGPNELEGAPVVRVPGFSFPFYRSLRLARPGLDLRPMLREFAPDIAYVAGPAVLGAMGLRATHELKIPSVAIFQTDVAQFATAYRARVAAPMIWAYLRRVHAYADLTLAPSRPTAWELQHHGIERVALWGRGVDAEMFHPSHRSTAMRRMLAPGGELIVGYVGRLASEKHVERLAVLGGMPGVRIVIVGDGPSRSRLEAQLPEARFLGLQQGPALGAVMASLDVFVHTGEHETFGQTIQEAQASAVPVIAPAAGGPLDLIQSGTTGF